MEIFNVNRQTYQHLGRMTYANLPSPSTVPEGTHATVYGWTAPDADWVTRGGYWIPKNGRAVVHAPTLVNAQAQSASLALVATVPGWTLPADMAAMPGLMIETWVRVTTSPPSSAQARLIYVGTDSIQNAIATFNVASLASSHRVWGEVARGNTDSWLTVANNAQPWSNGTGQGSTTTAQMLASPIRLYYRGGNTDGSEVLTVQSFSIAVGVG